MKAKVSELIGNRLDWAVAQCEGKDYCLSSRYSSDWGQGGPIIEREMIHLSCDNTIDPYNRTWHATITDSGGAEARGPNGCLIAKLEQPTPLVAAMRCYVARRVGEEIEIPDSIRLRRYAPTSGR